MTTQNSRPNPYVGPRAFQTGEALYGRDRELRQLLDLLIAERIVLLHSPSGAGKTSLIRAGLFPRLVEQGFTILPVIRINQEPPPGLELPKETNRYLFSALLSLEEDNPEPIPQAELATFTLRDYLAMRSEKNLEQVSPDGYAMRSSDQLDEVLVFDQFEEILTVFPTDQAGKEQFFEQLGAALRDRQRWALFSMREDYMAALAPYLRPIPTRFHTTYRLDLLGISAALQAIQFPPRTVGVEFSHQAATRLVDDLRKVQVQRADGSMEETPGPHVEPVQLQVVCYRLWQNLEPEDNQITISDLDKVGDVSQSLADYYAESVQAVAKTSGVPERMIREWFQRELITETGVRSQVMMGQETSGSLANKAITLLENAHLLRAEKRRGVLWFELAHDRLVDPVRSNNSTWFHANLSLLQRQAGLWQDENRAERLLLREEALLEAQTWAAENETVLTSFERDFLEACQQAEQRTHAERERQEQAVKLQEQARLAGKLRQRLVLASVAAVIALGFFIAAAYFGYQATAQRDIARSLANENATNAFVAQAASTQAVANAITAEANAQLANAASTQASVDRGIALAASTQAVAGQATAVSAQETSVYNEQVAEEQARLASSRQLASQSLNYLNNQPSLAALLAVAAYQASDTNEAKNAMLNNIQNQVSQNIVNLSGPLPTQNNAVYSVALSPDGTRLAWGLSEGTVILWNLQTSQIEKSYKEHLDKVLSLQFSADGRWLVSGGNEGTTIFLDMQSGETFPLQTFSSTPATVYSLSISPDSSQLALTRSTDVYIYDITDPRNPVGPQRLVGHTTSTLAVAWSSDGSLLASAGTDLSVRVWDPGVANPVRVFSGHTGDVLGLSWSPDNNLLASASQDGSVIVWDVANGGQSGLPLRGSVFDFFYSVSFSRDGQFLAAGRGNGTIMIWTVADRTVFEEITLNQEIVNAVQFSPQPGVNLLASGSFDGKPGLFNIKTLAPLAQPVTDVVLPGAVRSLQVLENGDLTLLVENPSGVQVFNLQDGNFVGGVNLSGIYSSAALSTDGEIALLGTADGTALAVDTLSAGQTGFKASLNGSPMSLTFDPSAERVAASTGFSMVAQRPQDTLLSIFRYPAGELLSDPIPVPELMTTLAFDGSSSLITGSETGVIYQWNLNNNQQVGIPLERHLSATRALAIFAPRRLLASGSDDRTLTLWDLTYGQALGPPLVGANDSILSLSFSTDGTQLYSGGADGVVLLWDVDPMSWLSRLCQIAGRNLTESEWIQFMPESEPYQKVCPDFP